MRATDRSKTLEQLENDVWGDPDVSSDLISRCHALHRKPLQNFSAADLRIMIGQSIGLEFLVPLAIERLEADLFIMGEYYDGDLLAAVLQADPAFYRSNAQVKRVVGRFAKQAAERLWELHPIDRRTIREATACWKLNR
ncbi:MAG: hypothetical protein AMXMBFR13_14770 [Phycisphaerae bacterium]